MNISKIRTVLNILFMIGAVVSVILYFNLGENNRSLFLYVCGTSLFIKMVEVVFRFFR